MEIKITNVSHTIAVNTVTRDIIIGKLNIKETKVFHDGKQVSCSYKHNFHEKECTLAYCNDITKFTKDCRDQNDFYEICKNVVTHLPEGDINPDNIFFTYWPGNIIFDINGEVVPYRYNFNYIGTPCHNKTLDLKEAITILKNHPDVISVSKIKDIPYYNRDPGCNKCIEVSILPSKETYNKFYQEVKSEKYWSVSLRQKLHDGYCPDEHNNYLGLLSCVKKEREECHCNHDDDDDN